MVLFVLFLAFALSSCAGQKMSTKEPPDMAGMQQELAGNMISGGYATKYNGMYYFVNESSLSQMDSDFENTKQLGDIIVSSSAYMQFADNKLFYLGIGEALPGKLNSQHTLYVYDLKENKESKLTGSDVNINNFSIYGDQIFFTTWFEMSDKDATGGQIYRMNLDGSDLMLLGNFDYDKFVQVANEKIYLSGYPSLLTMNLDGSDIQHQEIDSTKLLVYGDDIYFTYDNENAEQSGKLPSEGDSIQYPRDSGLYKKSLSDPDSEIVGLAKGIIPTFTISNNKIYFAAVYGDPPKEQIVSGIDLSRGQMIFEMDLDGKNLKNLVPGVTPIVLDNYLFYYPLTFPSKLTWLALE